MSSSGMGDNTNCGPVEVAAPYRVCSGARGAMEWNAVVSGIAALEQRGACRLHEFFKE